MIEKFQDRAKSIYEQVHALEPVIDALAKLNVPLDSDPTSKGLLALNEKIADIQKSKDYLCEISLKVINLKNQAENLLTWFEKELAGRKVQVMKENEAYYTGLKTQAMRDLALEEALKTEMVFHSKLVQLMNIIKTHREATQISLVNLESANNNLKRQLAVIEMMISIDEVELFKQGKLHVGRKLGEENV